MSKIETSRSDGLSSHAVNRGLQNAKVWIFEPVQHFEIGEVIQETMAPRDLTWAPTAQPRFSDGRQEQLACSVIKGNEDILAVGDSHVHHLLRIVCATHATAGPSENATTGSNPKREPAGATAEHRPTSITRRHGIEAPSSPHDALHGSGPLAPSRVSR